MARVNTCGSLGYCDYPLEVAARQMAARGWKQVEIASFNSYCIHYDYDTTTTADILDLLAKYGLTAVSMNYSVGKKGPNRQDREFKVKDPEDARGFTAQVRRLIDDSAAMGLKKLLVPLGFRTPARDEEGLRIYARLLSELAEYAFTRGVALSTELPNLYTIAYSLDTTLEFYSYVTSDKLINTIDSSHWGIARFDLRQLFKELGPRICHAQVRDAAGPDTADFKQKLELTAGKGEVDFVLFGQVLDEFGFQDDVSMEFEYRGGMSLEQIEREYDESIAYLKKCGWGFPASVVSKGAVVG